MSLSDPTWTAALVSAVGCAIAGLGVPALIRRIPEPLSAEAPTTEALTREALATEARTTDVLTPDVLTTDVLTPAAPGTATPPAAAPAPPPAAPPPAAPAPPAAAEAAAPAAPMKVPYATLASVPRLGLCSAGIAGVAGGLVGASVGWGAALLPLLVLCPLGVALGYVDWQTKLLPRVLVLPTTVVVLGLVTVGALLGGDLDVLVRALVGGAAYRSLFWVMWAISPKLMGFGDVRLAAVLGLALGAVGIGHVVAGYVAATVLGALLGRPLARLFPVGADTADPTQADRSRRRRVTHPFGPFMMAGALIGVLVGEPVSAWLLDAYAI